MVGFQLHYVFHANHMEDLRIGAAILRETLDRETEKEERKKRSREEQKAAEAAIAQNVRVFGRHITDAPPLFFFLRQVKLAFMDDRKTKMLRDQRERQLREARESAQGSRSAAAAPSSPSLEQSPPMPGPGYTLATGVREDQSPPYQA